MAFAPSLQKNAPARILNVGARNDDKRLGLQQASTLTIYDTYDLSGGGGMIPFFQNVQGKSFPFTNMAQNKFTKDKSMTVQRCYLTYFTVAGGQITSIFSIDASPYPQLAKAELNLIVGGSQILDRFALLSSVAPFNYMANFGNRSISPAVGNAEVVYSHSVYQFQAQPVILPDTEFIANIQIPAITAPAAGIRYLQLTLEGFGTLPKVQGAL